jgi:hypothetical protein
MGDIYLAGSGSSGTTSMYMFPSADPGGGFFGAEKGWFTRLADGPNPEAAIQEDSPSISYTGAWYEHRASSHSGGRALLSMDAGSTLTITYRGALQITGYRDQWSGIVEVVAPAPYGTHRIDTYGDTAEPRALLLSLLCCASGDPSTVTLRVTGERNTRSGGSWIWIDGITVSQAATPTPAPTATPTSTSTPTRTATPTATATATATSATPTATPTATATATARPTVTTRPTAGGAPIRHEEDAATYEGGPWFTNSMGVHSGGRARLAMDVGSRARFTFSGTAVSWIGYSDEWSGVARVLVDGTLRATVDTYASPNQAQRTLFNLGGLAAGSHTLTIEVTGTKGAASGGTWVWIDAFLVSP